MTIDEVVNFFNSFYGKQAYLYETQKEIRILTNKSVWRIFKDDYIKFGGYYLYHSNNSYGKGFHRQNTTKISNLTRLVWYAITHDSDNTALCHNFEDFQRKYEMFLYGQRLWESCCCFAFLSGETLRKE